MTSVSNTSASPWPSGRSGVAVTPSTRACGSAVMIFENRLDRTLLVADLVATPPEIMARFDGQTREPLPAEERQQELEYWRDFNRFEILQDFINLQNL
jgi:hypothetical protein